MQDNDKLTRMANGIGQFFEAYPDRAQALEEIANHIEKFWEPRMRKQLLAFIERYPDGRSAGGVSLLPIVAKAVRLHQERLRPM